MTSVLVRQASSPDLDAVAMLFDAYRVFYEQTSDVARAKDFMAERFKNSDSVVFLAEDETGTALGFTQLFPSFSSVSTERLWILNDLFVVASARGRRVGEQLIKRALQLARETKAKGVVLETAHNNISGQRLYERMGFVREDLEFRTYFLAV